MYVSALTSKRLLEEIRVKTGKSPSFAVQKFTRLIVSGFVKNGKDIESLSSVPYASQYSTGLIASFGKEVEEGIKYNYIPSIRLSVLTNLSQVIYTFFKVFFWGLSDRKNRCLVGDVLNVSIGLSSLLAARLAGIKAVGVVTDIPSLMLRGGSNRSLRLRMADKLTEKYVSLYTDYVLLTDQMSNIVNPHHRPYVVMEGLADSDFLKKNTLDLPKASPRIVMYAGGLHERYGLKTLVEAFSKLTMDDVQLLIYGTGPFVEDLKCYALQDHRIVYGGTVSNEEIVLTEQKATLLVNPRPTHEEFTKYSFPSKNIEYMASGTPLLTTKLPGMPLEYYSYVYLFEKEDVDGYYQALNEVLSKTNDELAKVGRSAREFITKYKNNTYQTKRILDFIEGRV